MVKKQINVVNLSVEDMNEDERTQIKQIIEEEEKQEETIPKPKRKTPTRKTKVKEEEEVINETIPEPIPETVVESPKEEPTKKIKTVELVKCDKCNKEMTLRSLRYTHQKYCTNQVINRNEIPVKRQNRNAQQINYVKEKPDKTEIAITPNAVELHLQKIREDKLKQKQEKIKKLISNIA